MRARVPGHGAARWLLLGVAAAFMAMPARAGAPAGAGAPANAGVGVAVVPPADFHWPCAINLIPVRDPWPSAMPRFWDLDNDPLPAFHHHFSYTSQQVTITYDKAPSEPFFVGHIEARGLKPNFAYQLKLAGKPRYGDRGWGTYGDDASNERIGYAGRWWCDTEQHNSDDTHYREYYQDASLARRHTLSGYLFMGDFVTDENGDASLDFNGAHSFHVTWQDHQAYGWREEPAGIWKLRSDKPPYYGYGRPLEAKPVRLWYERQSGRSFNVNLPRGTYHCRLLVTEESFHNLLGGTQDPSGGYWMTVLGSEGYTPDGHPDPYPANEVAFTIGNKGG